MNVITKTDFPGLKYRGKVRDTYQLDDKHLLMIAFIMEKLLLKMRMNFII